MSGRPGPGDAHAGDLLSALLDGELDRPTAASVTDHLQRCRPCAAELEAVQAVRFAVRTLPPVEPPAGFLEGLLANEPDGAGGSGGAEVIQLGRRSRRMAVANAAVSVAATVALLVLAVGTSPGSVAPGVGGAVALHTSAVSLLDGRAGTAASVRADPVVYRSTPSTLPWAAEAAVPEPFVSPTTLDGGYRLVRSFRGESGVHLVYESGPHNLSVFEHPGRCDFDALPPGGRRLAIQGLEGWQLETPGVDGRVVVVEHDDMVFVVVGDESAEAVVAAAGSIPGPRSSSAALLRRAAASSLEHLAPTG